MTTPDGASCCSIELKVDVVILALFCSATFLASSHISRSNLGSSISLIFWKGASTFLSLNFSFNHRLIVFRHCLLELPCNYPTTFHVGDSCISLSERWLQPSVCLYLSHRPMNWWSGRLVFTRIPNLNCLLTP